MEKIIKDAGGIDIGATHIYIGIEGLPVKSFETFTESFWAARDYLLSHGIKTVAMEATGVYWIILYEVLDAAGIDVWLVDGRQTRQVPGRKTDVKDCQWIQQLHSHGLLSRCFIPDDAVKEVRSYSRLREDHIRSSSMHVNHMQKALTMMNIRLKETLSQVHGASGLAMIEAILKGERDAQKLLSLCHASVIKNKSEKVLKALNGHYTEAGLFSLKQAYEGYKFYREQIKACDDRIQKSMERLNNFHEDEESAEEIKSAKKRKPIRHNKPSIDHLGGHLLKIFSGSDATQLPGITDYTWLKLYTEIGTDLSQWPTEKHFTSWLGLAPGQHQSGKKNKNRGKRHKSNAGQIFRELSQTLIESKQIALGVFGRRIKAKRGPRVAAKATARKLAVLYWRMMVKGSDYAERGIEAYEEKIQIQKERWIQKTAHKLGYSLTPRQQFETS